MVGRVWSNGTVLGLSKVRDVTEIAGHLENGQMVTFSLCCNK